MKSKQAVLVIDMINDFVKNEMCPLYSPNFKCIIPVLQQFLTNARERNIPIVFVCDHHRSKNSICVKKWGVHAMNGTQSAEIVDELVPFAKIRVNKQYNDSFFRSKLDATLKKLGVTEIIIVGIQTNYCIRGTAEGGYYRGYSVNVISDCVTDEDEESHEIGLKTISSLSGTVINSDNFGLEFDSYNF